MCSKGIYTFACDPKTQIYAKDRLSSCMTTVAQEVKFMYLEMTQFQERPPHPSLSPSLKKVKETFASSHKISVILSDSILTLDFSNHLSMKSLKVLQIMFLQGEDFRKGKYY